MVKIGVPLRYSHLDGNRPILFLGERVRRCLQKAGAIVIPIVQVQDVDYADTEFDQFEELTLEEKKEIDDYLDMVDGVFFPGGNKVTPFDQYLLERCIDKDIPTLGVCLGMQLMSCYKEAFKVYETDSYINHCQEDDFILSHKVIVKKDSLLYRIIGEKEIMVNSFHHYHVSENPFYDISAVSEDGYIEAIEKKDRIFHLGVQWHPEISYDFDENSRKIIDSFLDVCLKNGHCNKEK